MWLSYYVIFQFRHLGGVFCGLSLGPPSLYWVLNIVLFIIVPEYSTSHTISLKGQMKKNVRYFLSKGWNEGFSSMYMHVLDYYILFVFISFNS